VTAVAPSGPDPAALAALLCDWCLEVKPGQRIGVFSTTLGEAVAAEMQIAILERDAWPHIHLQPTGSHGDFLRHAGQRHRSEPHPMERAVTEALDARVRIDAPANASELSGVDPSIIAAVANAAAANEELRRSRRWCNTLFPTPALAQRAGMSTREYAAFVNRALFLDRPDPAAAWAQLSARQAHLAARLRDARQIRIEAEGTDLVLDVSGRGWVNSDGRRNMPSGEVFTGPHERSANGTVRFSIPTGPPGVTVAGVALEFRDGEVVCATAQQGEDYLRAALATDAGSRFLGELGIGTNAGIDRATGHILLDEKMAGTVHLALGRSYPETGGTNVSALHWDLVCDLRAGGRLTADGELIDVELGDV
jgi:aminopeptidase